VENLIIVTNGKRLERVIRYGIDIDRWSYGEKQVGIIGYTKGFRIVARVQRRTCDTGQEQKQTGNSSA
jgi:hypothetical protein